MNSKLILTVAIGLTSSALLLGQNTNTAQLESLKSPRITRMKNQKMLVVEAKGDPNVVGPKAFGLLFQVYYSIKETPKGPFGGIPRARWPESLEAKSEWVGKYALPVPDAVTTLPPYSADKDLKIYLTQWEYGEMGEILHTGSYKTEAPTMKRLTDFIKQQGYVTVGGHEEEYLRGPSMNGPGDPEKYLTIIRYRVRKAGDAHSPGGS